MNKLSIRLFSTALAMMLGIGIIQAQIVINEISYNPPESGTDSLEYVELYNAGGDAVDLEGWYFTAGIIDTLPAVMLQPGEYFVTCVNAAAMMNVFGITAHEWSGGGLSNGGELISIANADGVDMDSVEFDDKDPWPVSPDGDGPSLELKDPASNNNDAVNWQSCGTGTGVIINGNEVFGTPGAENSEGGAETPDVTVEVGNLQFNPKHIVVEQGGLVRWVNNEAVAHNVNGDQGTFPNNPASFGNGAPAANWEWDYMPDVVGLYDYQCDPHAGAGMAGTMSVYDPNNYTDFPLDHLRLTDGINGQYIFVGVPTRVTGVVHGVNYRPSGYSFYIIDGNNVGINVFSFDPLSYTVAEGDMITVSGTIASFNGLLEIVPDEIEVISTGNELNTPRDVDEVGEMDESSYLTSDLVVDSVSNISSSGYTIYTTHENGTHVEVRVDDDAEITLGPDDFTVGLGFNVVGIGTQYDNNFPWLDGYQLQAVDIDVVSGVEFLAEDAISMLPNPASSFIRLNSDLMMMQIEIYATNGQQVYNEAVQSHSHEVSINSLPVGLHMVKVTTREGVWTSMVSIVR